MKILSMNATFGKLSNATLQLEPGLNIIHAPNEWGKSTWCAFVEAMLYGIETSSRSKTGFLADKEHYAPWSGEPMSGRMDILWNNKKITIERKNKGRTPFGEIKVYETETGLTIPELSVHNCGEILLGVERSVFARSGFLKQSQMPVTEDEKLRRRLNELVTTGDESGESESLAQKLRDLKNRCRFNKKGLLPELEAQQAEVDQKLMQLQQLQMQIASIEARQAQIKAENRLLTNHLAALSYQENLAHTQRLAAAQVAKDTAQLQLQAATQACEKLPSPEKLQEDLFALRQLRDQRERLSLETVSQKPETPYSSTLFQGKDPDTAVLEAKQDTQTVQLLAGKRSPLLYILGGILLLAGASLFFLWKIPGIVAALCGIALFIVQTVKSQKLRTRLQAVLQKYPGLSVERWVSDAESYRDYCRNLSAYQQDRSAFDRRREENTAAFAALTGNLSAAEFEQFCLNAQEQHRALQAAREKYAQAESYLQALTSTQKEVAAPTFPDEMTLPAFDAQRQLENNRAEEQSLRHRLGICQGQMDTLGQEQDLLAQKSAMAARHEKLEAHYAALTFAMETLEKASRELQRRFAPRISQRAQEIFSRLTGGRYKRLALCQDLSLETAAENETTLRGSLWRSDGTVDQLYLALRLAVAQELTPNAPLILDDALVRFDDTRLASAMELLKEESQAKQVIVFTCQSREESLM
ncbi:MAG: AAA family ATPase [Oscillospiraceae bacterium]|nr:AAA family ATPase [Oscillospiraceae bacterium]